MHFHFLILVCWVGLESGYNFVLVEVFPDKSYAPIFYHRHVYVWLTLMGLAILLSVVICSTRVVVLEYKLFGWFGWWCDSPRHHYGLRSFIDDSCQVHVFLIHCKFFYTLRTSTERVILSINCDSRWLLSIDWGSCCWIQSLHRYLLYLYLMLIHIWGSSTIFTVFGIRWLY